MEASGVRPGPDPFLRAESVHFSARTRITRLFFSGRTVIRKESLGPDEATAAGRMVPFLAGLVPDGGRA
jgi:hypothetical protein